TIHSKFYPDNTRNDPMLIYVSNEKLESVLNFLDNLNEKHPEYFVDGGNKAPFTAPVRPYAGIADESKYKSQTSFNYEIGSATDEFVKDYSPTLVSQITQNPNKIRTQKGNTYTLPEYITQRIKQGLIETTLENKKVNYTGVDEDITKNHKQFFSELEQKIITEINETNSDLNQMIAEEVQSIYQRIQAGYIPNDISLSVKTTVPYISKRDKILYQDRNKQIIKEKGFRNAPLYLNINLIQELFEIYGITYQIEQELSIETLAPYLEKHHISPVAPYLNTETIQDYQNYETKQQSKNS
ncbi:MAG: hypothetical protein J6C13_03415, partial [Clostridia bacterium]|nr:hypothetical protein [Clostridia bacterium]